MKLRFIWAVKFPNSVKVLERIRKYNIEWPYISRVARIYFMYRPMLNYALGFFVVHLHVRIQSIIDNYVYESVCMHPRKP
jgi:hypothetical protein